ncbi:MAG: hypothetical protein KY476_20200 [Planctomycetes bacterium]|nr:hypothetical protein [Planctomycetota bacterium]
MKKLFPVVLVLSSALILVAVADSRSDEVKSGDAVRGTLLAQAEEKADAPKATARKKPRGRLPNYYGQLGISQQQRTEIYAVQALYSEEIDALEKQLAELKEKRDAEVEAVLTAEQKAKLAEIIESKKKPAAPKATAKAAPAEAAAK